MKTLKTLSSLMGLSVIGLAACGGGGGGGDVPFDRRFNFSAQDVFIVNPINGANNVCHQVPIQFEVPCQNTGLCNNSSGFEDAVILERPGTSETFPLTPARMVSRDNEANTAILETYIDAQALAASGRNYPSALSTLRVLVDITQAGSSELNQSDAVSFTLATYEENANCPGTFVVTSTDWENTTFLRTGLADENGDPIFEVEDFEEIFQQYVNQQGFNLFGFGHPNFAPIELEMNESISASGLLTQVRMYEMDPFNFPAVFEAVGPSEAIISIDPTNSQKIRISPPAGGNFASGTYVIFVDQVISTLGKVHPFTSFKIVSIN